MSDYADWKEVPMPPNKGIDWEGLTGKAMEDITVDDKLTIIIGTLITIEKRTQCIPRHDKLIWAGCVLVPTLFGLFAWLAERLL